MTPLTVTHCVLEMLNYWLSGRMITLSLLWVEELNCAHCVMEKTVLLNTGVLHVLFLLFQTGGISNM
jgi:hypothetical protein